MHVVKASWLLRLIREGYDETRYRTWLDAIVYVVVGTKTAAVRRVGSRRKLLSLMIRGLGVVPENWVFLAWHQGSLVMIMVREDLHIARQTAGGPCWRESSLEQLGALQIH